MREKQESLLIFLLLLLTAVAAPAQVKLASVSGSPGALTEATGLVFPSAGDVGYLTNPGSGVLQKFRVATGEILETLQLVSGIGPMTLSPNGKTLAVVGVANQTIYLVDVAGMKVRKQSTWERTGFTARNNIVFSPDSMFFYIADPLRNRIVVFNAMDGAHDRDIGVGVNPNILSVIPKESGRYCTVLCSGKKTSDLEALYTIDTYYSSIIDIQTLPQTNTEPFNNLAFTITGSYLFLPVYNQDRLAVYDLTTHILASRAIEGRGPAKAFTSPTGRLMAIINAKSSNISVYPLPEAVDPWTIEIPGITFSTESTVAFSPNGHYMYVPSAGTHEIVVCDIENQKIVDRILTGRGPLLLQTDVGANTLTSVDVGSNELSLIALNPRSLALADLVQSSTEYSGLALSNFTGEATNVTLIARDNKGALLPGTNNPAIVTIPAHHQSARVADQLFGFDPTGQLEGYIEGFTIGTQVSLLYMRGTIGQTQLDGILADAVTSKILGFTRITDGVSRFGAPTSTEIILVNLTGQDAAITYRLFGDNLEGKGQLIGYATSSLPARSRIRGPVSQFVQSGRYPLENVYFEVVSSAALKGLELIRIGDSMAVIPATPVGLPDTEFFGTQFASGGAGVLQTPIFSDVSISNSTNRAINVTAQVTDEKGNLIPVDSEPLSLTLEPFQTVSGGADKLFGFPDPLTDPALYQGSLKVSADSPGLILDLLLGDARDGAYLTAADMHAQRGREFAFGHIAEGLFGAPPKGMFTGIAMFNPNRQFASITVEAFSPTSESLGHVTILLAREARTSKTLGELLPIITQQNGGTLKITSDLPIYLYEVFGGSDNQFMSTVPPVILKP